MADKLKLIEVEEAMKPLVTYLAVGEDEGLQDQLIAKSRQPAILQFTPNDAKKRFGNRQMLQEWLAKGREIHWLLGQDNDLAGIIWYGKSEFPLDISLSETPTETFAIRIYEGYAGHGLARPFMKLSLQTYVKHKQSRGERLTGIWLQTDVDNPAALSAYAKFGYTEVDRDEKRVTMVLTPEQMLALM